MKVINGLILGLVLSTVSALAYSHTGVEDVAFVDTNPDGVIEIVAHAPRLAINEQELDPEQVLTLFLMHSTDQVTYKRIQVAIRPFKESNTHTFIVDTSLLPEDTNYYRIVVIAYPYKVYWGNPVGSRRYSF